MRWTSPRRLPAAVALAVLCAPAGARPAAAGPLSLDAAVAHLVASSKLPADRIAVAVVDPATGAVLASHRARASMTPASCQKLATTGAAMAALGPDFPIRTRLLAAPPASAAAAAVIPGDLWLEGSGDPGFSEHGPEGGTLAALDAFAAAAAARGVRTVRGDLVLDTAAFSGPRVHDSWTDVGPSAKWYAAEVDALTVNDGCVDVTVEPGAGVGDAGRLSLFPETSLVELVNRVTTVGTRAGHGFGFRLSPERNLLEVNGGVWTKSSGATAPASLRDPALFAAEQVGRALARAGIRVEGVVRRPAAGETRPGGLAVLAEHRTTLAEAAAVANTRSQNLWAELLLRVLGRETRGEGSFVEGAKAVRGALQGAGAEIAEDLRPVDGSGLSRENRASALSLCRVLAHLHGDRTRDAFFGGLARPGVGTLDDRFPGTRFRDRVFAKTGTLRGVSGLAGLVLGEDGRARVFAVLGERVDVGLCRRLQDRVVDALVGTGR